MAVRRQINRYADKNWHSPNRRCYTIIEQLDYTGEPMYKQSAKKAAMRHDAKLGPRDNPNSLNIEFYRIEKHNGRYEVIPEVES